MSQAHHSKSGPEARRQSESRDFIARSAEAGRVYLDRAKPSRIVFVLSELGIDLVAKPEDDSASRLHEAMCLNAGVGHSPISFRQALYDLFSKTATKLGYVSTGAIADPERGNAGDRLVFTRKSAFARFAAK